MVEPQPQVIVRAVGVQAVKRVVRQRGGDIVHRVKGLGDEVAVGIPLGVFGQRKVHRAVYKGERQHGGQQAARPVRPGAPKPPQPPKQQHAQHADAENAPKARLEIDDAEAEVAIVVGIGHQRERRRAERDERHRPPGMGNFTLGQVGAGEQGRRGPAQHQHRHIVPPRIVAGVERVERAVEYRHERAHHAQFEQAAERVAAARTAKRQPAHDADERQVGRHAGVFEDAALEQILKIGRVGH